MFKTSTILLFVAWFLFFLFHNIFNYFSLYWMYYWLDIPMHLIGGILIVLSLFFLQNKLPEIYFFKNKFYILVYLFITTIIWEIYQVLAGKEIDENYTISTMFDISLGMIGGITAFWWLFLKDKNK